MKCNRNNRQTRTVNLLMLVKAHRKSLVTAGKPSSSLANSRERSGAGDMILPSLPVQSHVSSHMESKVKRLNIRIDF